MFEKGNKKGKRFGEGQPTGLGGRPKKITLTLKEEGYAESQVYDTMKVLLAQSIADLEKISKDKTGQYTALETVCAGAIVSNHKRKTQYNVLQLVERIWGKPKEKVEGNFTGTIELTMDLGGEHGKPKD